MRMSLRLGIHTLCKKGPGGLRYPDTSILNAPQIGGKDTTMSTAQFGDYFKRHAVHHIVEHGYPVTEVSKRLASAPARFMRERSCLRSHIRDGSLDEQAAEARRLKLELAFVTQERNILKMATAYLAGDASEVRVHRRASPGIFRAALCRSFASNPAASMLG